MDVDIKISEDTLFDGRLVCYQNKNGYRFSIDSVLLADFSQHWKNANILDMGCGCGILGLLLLYRNFGNIVSISGIELQKSLAELAKTNGLKNNYCDKLNIQQGDYCEIGNYFEAEQFSHVICNPPFYKIGRGRPNINIESFLARHQSRASITDIVNCIAYSLKNKGSVSLIYPANLLAELISELVKRNIQPKRLQMVYSYPESDTANLVMVEAIKNGGVGLQVLSPLFIYTQRNGDYTKEIQAIYAP